MSAPTKTHKTKVADLTPYERELRQASRQPEKWMRTLTIDELQKIVDAGGGHESGLAAVDVIRSHHPNWEAEQQD